MSYKRTMSSSVDKPEDWNRTQERVFTKWCNSVLSQRGHGKVGDVTGFQDGTALLKVVEILTGCELHYNKEPKCDQDKLENLELLLKCMKKEGKCGKCNAL